MRSERFREGEGGSAEVGGVVEIAATVYRGCSKRRVIDERPAN